MAAGDIDLSIDSALDLKLKGSVGSFKIGGGSNRQSLDVKYFMTHVSLNFAGGVDEKLLRELAPVREIFDPEQLDFDEIMQRDIDDSRVSSKLIPYILDDRTQDLIKFFPPIVVVALPVQEDRNRPARYYPKVNSFELSEKKQGVEKWAVMRSGEIGSEVFQFEQPILSGKKNKHDLVSFQINTSKCRLIIVDGQHRAMALLALYRNLKDQWGDERKKPFEKYYKEWTPNYIRGFDLTEINLPMIICTIPTLDEAYSGDYDLKKASRSIFLTLNKTAQQVSRTRNLLLNDNDLISSFMRKTLGIIKNSDNRSSSSLKIHNIELDQDKQKLSSPIAVSGVTHIYYMIEHMLLDDGNVRGVSPRSGRFGGRAFSDVAKSRLNCLDLLGRDVFDAIKRDSFTSNAEDVLGQYFLDVYGEIIIYMLEKFLPFERHNYSANMLQNEINKQTDIDLSSMLFAGQGMVRVFEDHRKNLKTKLQNGDFGAEAPRIDVIVKGLDDTEKRLKLRIREFHSIRATNFLLSGSDKNKYKCSDGGLDARLIPYVNDLYSNVYTSVAFQSAIVCGFFNEYEKASSTFRGESNVGLNGCFEEYIGQLNDFFAPNNFSRFKRLLSVMFGKSEGESINDLKVSHNSSDSFRSVVFPDEMQPDQWPKYRYLMLEIWKPSNSNLAEQVSSELKYCRDQVFTSAYERRKKTLAQELRLPELTSHEDLTRAFDEVFEMYSAFLKYLGRSSEINESHFKKAICSTE